MLEESVLQLDTLVALLEHRAVSNSIYGFEAHEASLLDEGEGT
jgi:hypothetical protein